MIDIEKLKVQVDKLNEETQISSMGPQGDIIFFWRGYVLSNLSRLLDEHLAEELLSSRLKSFLSNCFEMSLGAVVSYTASPTSDITLLLVAVAREVAPENPLKVLMPRVSQKSVDTFYPDLNESCVEELLKTHILSNSGDYLYPIKILTKIPWEDQKNPNNPYRTGDDICLSDTEYTRLKSHSKITQSIFRAKEKIAFEEAQNILKHSLHVKAYDGCEKNSLNLRMVSYVYGGRRLPIIFIEFLQNLPEHESDEILLKTLDDPNFIQNLDFLRSFILELPSRQQLISIKKTRASVIKKIPYFLKTLHYFPDNERREKIKNILTMFIENGLHFRVLLKHATLTQRTEIYELMSPIFPDFIKSRSDLDNVFKYLPEKERLAAYDRIGVRGLTFFKNADEHHAFLTNFHLPNDSKVMASPTALSQASDAISSFGNFIKIWSQPLGSEERISLYRKVKPLLPTLIETGRDFMKLCLYSTPELCADIYACMKPYFSNLLKNNYLNFRWIFECLTQEQRSEAYEEMKDLLPDLIKTPAAFKQIFTYLTHQQRVEILEKLENKLSDIFTTLAQQDEHLHMFGLNLPHSLGDTTFGFR